MIWTIQKIISWSTEYLNEKGVESPRLDTEVLLAHILQKDRLQLYTHFDQPLQEKELQDFKNLLKRRATREPLAYILGEKEFYSLKFKVTPDTLIPRPETEQLVEVGVEFLLKNFLGEKNNLSTPLKILDLATGSGCVLIGVLFDLLKNNSRLPRPFGPRNDGEMGLTIKGIGVDFNANVLKVAQENAELHELSTEIQWLEHDLSQAWPQELYGPFHLITTNLPYVSVDEHQTLQVEVRDFEPKAALVPGSSGLEAFHWVLPQLTSRLTPGGLALLEMGADQGNAVWELAEQMCSDLKGKILKDLSGKERILFLYKDKA